MKEFKEYLSRQEFHDIFTTKESEGKEVVHQALDKFLTENNLLKPFTNHETHRTNIGYYWESYLSGKIEDYQKKRLFSAIIDKYAFGKYALYYEQNEEKAYNLLNEKINQGNFEPFELIDTLYDYESGEEFMLLINNWTPSLVNLIPGETYHENSFELAQPEPIQKVIEAQIEFKTGNLIVADWFRIEEFTKTVDTGVRFDANCEKGRIEKAKYYLENFNFIHTSADNDSYLYQKDNTFVFAQYDENFDCPEGYEEKGSVIRDLRALSIIEKEHLIEIVGSQEKVQMFLNGYGSMELSVKPGTYTFTLSSSPNRIKKEFKKLDSAQTKESKKEVSQLLKDKHFQPTLIMQALELKPEKKLKMK